MDVPEGTRLANPLVLKTINFSLVPRRAETALLFIILYCNVRMRLCTPFFRCLFTCRVGGGVDKEDIRE